MPSRCATLIYPLFVSMKTLTPDRAEEIRRNPPINLNLAEAAAYLTISPRHLWDLVSQSTTLLRAARLGRRRVFTRVNLDRYLESQAT
jgi:predicted DNA-binding transcriptional regulator AlpA